MTPREAIVDHHNTGRAHEPIPAETDAVARQIVDAALTVHRALGPGLLESVYEACLAHELSKRGLSVARQVALPVQYDGIQLDAGLRIDLVVENRVVVELKPVEQLLPVHRAQTLSYLSLGGCRLALLINFYVPIIKNGIERIVL